MEATTFPSLLILLKRGEQDGLSKTLLVILFDKSHSVGSQEFYFHMWTLYPGTCPTEMTIKGLEKWKCEEC